MSVAMTARRLISPSAASVPATQRSESPGRNGVTTSPASQNTMTKSSPYTHTPCCLTNSPRCTSRCTTRCHRKARSSIGRLYNRRASRSRISQMAASAVLTNPSVERVRAALERAGMAADIVELPGAARTAKAAADFLGCQVAQIANSLVFRAQASDTAVLVMSSGACRVDVARLAQLLGEPIAKADADFVRRHTGFAIGG